MSQKASIVAKKPVKGALTEIADVAIYQPSDNQILIKAEAFAANPTDWKHIVFQEGKPGDIAGSDASGVVVKVGANVKGFKEGDKVSTFLHGNFSKERGAFAEYVIGDPSTTIKYENQFKGENLPEGSTPGGKIDSFESAASITLSLTTVVLSLVGNLNVNKNGSGFILIWGGATSTGILAIQLIHLYFKNYKIITTSSSKNAEYLKSIGADFVVDYHDSDAVSQIRDITKGEIRYALDTVSSATTFQSVYDATYESEAVKFDTTLFLGEKDIKKDDRSGSVEFVSPTLAYTANGDDLSLFGGNFKADDATLERYNEFWLNKLPSILPELVHPRLRVLKAGLESANKAFDLLQDNKVSGEKIVFRL